MRQFPVPASFEHRPPRRAALGAEIPPGPNAGRAWRDAPATHRDELSGRTVARLTNYRGHSHHLAGAAPCWLDGGRRLVIVSDREGFGNLFAYDFAAAVLTQLTDLRGSSRPDGLRLLASGELEFRYGATAYQLELATLRMREVAAEAGSGGKAVGRTAFRRNRSRSSVVPPEGWAANASPVGADAAARGGGAKIGDAELADGRRVVWMAVGRGRRVLAATGASGAALHAAAAPCLRPGVEQMIFVSDAGGYAQLYAVDASAPAALPRLGAVARG